MWASLQENLILLHDNNECSDQPAYHNHATTNFAVYSNETSQDKVSESLNRLPYIFTQVHDKLHENLFMLISLNQ